MRKSRFSEEQIIGLLREAEAGRKVADLCREHGISEPTFYRWKSKYSGMDVGDAKKLRALGCPMPHRSGQFLPFFVGFHPSFAPKTIEAGVRPRVR